MKSKTPRQSTHRPVVQWVIHYAAFPKDPMQPVQAPRAQAIHTELLLPLQVPMQPTCSEDLCCHWHLNSYSTSVPPLLNHLFPPCTPGRCLSFAQNFQTISGLAKLLYFSAIWQSGGSTLPSPPRSKLSSTFVLLWILSLSPKVLHRFTLTSYT